ncbi:MAG TPA: hypothetical protein EYQ20_13615 [candidate division Zixibacteria bacterium]|nr:hypothetical protein [candidate division Zixibacteria bacterium]
MVYCAPVYALVFIRLVRVIPIAPASVDDGFRSVMSMRMIKFRYIPMYYLLVLFPHTVGAQAEEPLSRLDTLVQIAQEHNPAISAAQNRWQAATQRRPQTSSLDDPMFSYRIQPWRGQERRKPASVPRQMSLSSLNAFHIPENWN